MPGLRGDHGVELATSGIPRFKRCYLDLEPAVSGQLRHAGVGIDAEYLAAGRPKQPGRDAGAAADVDDPPAGAGSDDPVHQGGGVARAGPVVLCGVRAERLRHLPLPMSFRTGTWPSGTR